MSYAREMDGGADSERLTEKKLGGWEAKASRVYLIRRYVFHQRQ